MSWQQDERERAYTNLCDAVTAAGRDNEPAFFARLCLLLMEELGDAAAFDRALKQAAVEDDRPST